MWTRASIEFEVTHPFHPWRGRRLVLVTRKLNWGEAGSACAVLRRMRAQKIVFPRRIARGIGKGEVLWGELDHSRVLEVLHNPRYAGAFVYGRRRTAYNAELKQVQLQLKRENWQVLIRDAHPGYISWDEFERNELTVHVGGSR